MKRLLCILLCFGLLIFPAAAGENGDISLSLACTDGTGYCWTAVSSDAAVLAVQDLGAEARPQSLPGAANTQTILLTPGSAGDVTLTLSFLRPWEKVMPLYRFTLRMHVDETHALTLAEITAQGQWDWATEEDRLSAQWTQGAQAATVTLSSVQGGEDVLTLFETWEDSTGVLCLYLSGTTLTGLEFSHRTQDVPFAPEFLFTTTDFEGEPVTEQIFAGHSLTILNFWEPWCGPCVRELPALEQLHRNYGEQGVQVVGVFATPNADEEVTAALTAAGVTYPIVRYTSEFDFLQTGYVPTTVVIGASGNILVEPFAQSMNYDQWAELVEELL